MKKDYDLLSKSEKLKYWEGVIAHKIRVQAEAGGDPDSSITEEFIEHCRKRDEKFKNFIPALGLTFPVMKKYLGKSSQGPFNDPLKKGVSFIAAVTFFGMQILLIIKEGYRALIFAGIVNSVMGAVYYIGVRINNRIKKIYRSMAEITGLSFKYATGGLPGFLYDPCLDGFYNGFHINISFENRWTGRWSHGLIGLGQPQTTSKSILKIKLPSSILPEDQAEISRLIDQNRWKGDLSFSDDLICLDWIGTLHSDEMKNELIEILTLITNSLFQKV